MGRLFALLSVLLASFALGKAADDWRLASAVAAIGTVLSAIGPRWEVDRGRRLLTAGMGGGAGYIVAKVFYEPHAGALDEGWTRFAAACILAASARFLLMGSGARSVTTGLVFIALLAVGETHVAGYGIFVTLFVVLSMWAPIVQDEHVLLTGTQGRRLAAGGAVIVLGVSSAAAATLGARRAYEWLSSRERSTALMWSPRIGFSDQIDLGALDGLLDSDTVVLRVRGPRVDYLRGTVLDSYAGGRWFRSAASEVEVADAFVGDAAFDDGVKITAVSERTDRYFVPLEARSLTVTPPTVLVDRLGVMKRSTKRGDLASHFVVGPRDRAELAPPTVSDLAIPRSLRPRLAELAAEWTAGAETTADKLDAIEHRFKTEFHYAQAFSRISGPDPVLDFLFGNRSGHCEYFATAMALVARAAGIPARFVGGYRVGEQSPFGYYVVRERNAHAWVEVWVPDRGWTIRDATPDLELLQNREHRSGYLASLSDGLSVGYDDVADWLQRRTLRQTAVAWGVGFSVLVWIVARGVRRRGVADAETRDDEVALPCLEVLLATLARAGVVHDGREPIERLAARTADPEGARLLERYAALRYGGIGDAASLTGDVAAYARSSGSSLANDGE
jgi:transglutaminase-like putative cysteine protease